MIALPLAAKALPWKAIAVAGAITILLVATLWYRGQVARCEAKSAELEGAYNVLAEKVQEQNAAMLAWEGKAKDAQTRSAKALAAAKDRGAHLVSRADAADQALKIPAPPSPCPAAAGVAEARRLIRGAS